MKKSHQTLYNQLEMFLETRTFGYFEVFQGFCPLLDTITLEHVMSIPRKKHFLANQILVVCMKE
jgi:hypothetical protein